MKWEKAAEAVKKWGFYSKWSKNARKWKKRTSRMKWIPRIYRKRKHLGNIVYSVMYLTAKKD